MMRKELLSAEALAALAALEAKAAELGRKAIASASRSGDLDHHLDEGELDPHDLIVSYWQEGPYRDELAAEYAGLDAATRSALEQEDVLQHLFRVFDAQWDWLDREDMPGNG